MSRIKQTNHPDYLLFCVAICFLLNIIMIGVASVHLRPIADDYCFGSVAQSGVLGGVITWWNTWSGFIHPMFWGNLLVGLPLLYLPWSLASSIAFLVASILIGIVVIVLLGDSKLTTSRKLMLCFMTTCLWWVFLWAPEYFASSNDAIRLMGWGLTHWQTLNATYIVQFQVLIILIFLVIKRKKNDALTFLTASLLGILSGTSGSSESLAILLCCICLLCSIKLFPIFSAKFFGRLFSQKAYPIIIVLCITLCIGLLFSHKFSPGHQVRLSRFTIDFNFGIQRILSLVQFTVPYSIAIIVKTYVSYSSLIVLCVTTGISFLLARRDSIFDSGSLLKLAITLTGASGFFSLSTRLAEAFIYSAFWHFSSSFMLIFLSVIFFGLWIGNKLGKISLKVYQQNLIYCALFLLLFLSTSVNVLMASTIMERQERWVLGSAPIFSSCNNIVVSDIEKEWVAECWKELNNARPKKTLR